MTKRMLSRPIVVCALKDTAPSNSTIPIIFFIVSVFNFLHVYTSILS